ncbi:MAG: hypothetical protein SGI99_03620 [Pseudomonadota bacterium]|nr:hypothetical protein [Pseudomonadota bacterium]
MKHQDEMKAGDENHARNWAIASGTLVFLLGALLCWLIPERSFAWVLAMLTLPAAWLSQHVLKKLGMNVARASTDRRTLARAMAAAGLIMTVSMAAVLIQKLGWIEAGTGELSKRAWGLIIGAMVIAYANVIPKIPGSARLQAALRFSGWVLVLAGMTFSAIWLLVPLNYASTLATWVLLSGLVVILARVSWCYLQPRSAPPTAPG